MYLSNKPTILVAGKGYSAYRGYSLVELNDAGFDVWLCDDEELTTAEGLLVQQYMKVDFAQDPVSEAKRIFTRLEGIEFLRGVCYIENLLPWAAEFCHEIAVPFIDPAAARRVRSKYAMREAFAAAGLNTPWHVVGTAAELPAANVRFPAIVKPEEGYSSIGVELVTDHAQLREYLGRSNNVRSDSYVLEGIVRGREYSIEGYIRDGAVVTSGLTYKFKTRPPFFEETGQYCSRSTKIPAEYERLFAAAARSVGIESTIFHFEFMVDGDVLTPIEIGARLAGDKIPYLHRRVSGRSILLDFLDQSVEYPRTEQQGIGIVFFVPTKAGTVSDSFPPAGLEAELGECFFECASGKVVQTAPHDFFVRLGFAIVPAETIEDFVVRANRKIDLFEHGSGIELHRLELDVASSPL